MPSCVIPTCKNASGRLKNNQEISFHRFPCDEETKEYWVRIVRKTRLEENWSPTKKSVICSVHFEEKDVYETNGSIRRIQKGAIPLKNIATEVIKSQDTNKNETEPSANDIVSTLSQSDLTPDTNYADMEYILDSSRERNLRCQIHRKIKYIHKYKYKIKLLKRRNAELLRRNRELKDAILKCVEKTR